MRQSAGDQGGPKRQRHTKPDGRREDHGRSREIDRRINRPHEHVKCLEKLRQRVLRQPQAAVRDELRWVAYICSS